MIAEHVFAELWGKLCLRFNRKVNESQSREYYEYLTKRLDTEQFRGAVERVWAEDERWPRPKRFLEAAPPAKRSALPVPLEFRDPGGCCVCHITGRWVHERRQYCKSHAPDGAELRGAYYRGEVP